MKFSLITPTHDLKYITELFYSIKSQTYENWEWILYLNNNAIKQYSELSNEITSHPKIKVFREETNNTNIGYLKNKAFHSGTGDILVEVDHDDLLTDNCLQRLYDVYSENPDVGFVYSDNAKLQMSGNFIPYNSAVGWTHGKFNYKGTELYHMHSFEPTAQSMSFIWYEPDHVRSWRSDIYKELGGHNSEYDVLDDQELILRTYLITKFIRIPEVLYIYRITGDNTWLERNAKIQLMTLDLYAEYAHRLAERDADLRGLLKIDISQNGNKPAGYISVGENSDYICDLNNGLPFDSDSVGIIRCDHVLHKFNNKLRIMSELHRVLADFGWAMIKINNIDSIPHWDEKSLLYFTETQYASTIKNNKIRFQSFRNDKVNGLDLHAYLSCIKSDIKRPHSIKI
jgi:glycosyltransferase involved in cell wall biosynthesis